MPKLLLNLRNVPDDEAADVLALLERHGIGHYETPPNRWGISAGGIWLKDESGYAEARRLLDEYQRERGERARAERAAAIAAGTAETFADVVRREPLRVLLVALGVLALIALCALPYWLLRG